jgi:hypothetical protein
MTDILQRALVSTPLGTLYTDQSIVFTLQFLNDSVALTEHTPESRVYRGTVRVIGNTFTIRCLWVEVLSHVLLSQLAEGAGFEAKELEHLVELGYVGCYARRLTVIKESYRVKRGWVTNGRSRRT